MCGGILFFQGWRLDPILLLSQILLGGSTIFFMAESLYLRNDLNSEKDIEMKDIDSGLAKKRYIRENYRSLNFLNDRKEWDKLYPTLHISYGKENKKGH